MMDVISFVGFVLTVILLSISIGRFIEKIDRFLDSQDDNDNEHTKNDRR